MTLGDLKDFAFEAALGFAIALVTGWLLVRLLARLQLRQTTYEDAPQSHQGKTGTPTMGGLAILAPIAAIGIASPNPGVRALLVLVFGCALVGFVDDYLGIRSGRNVGLRARTKFLASALIGVLFLRLVPDTAGTLLHVGGVAIVAPHWAWLALGILAITGTAHAVNLSDGLDGLAAGAIMPPLYVFWALAVAMQQSIAGWPVLLPFAIGGCLGFLVYNRYPARMFMGDTGSLALGALLSGAAILDGQMLLLLVVGGLFVAEALSVMLQVAYFKLTAGRRIFLMSPLHHHFELAGWPERVITLRFWLASAICSVVGWVIGHAG